MSISLDAFRNEMESEIVALERQGNSSKQTTNPREYLFSLAKNVFDAIENGYNSGKKSNSFRVSYHSDASLIEAQEKIVKTFLEKSYLIHCSIEVETVPAYKRPRIVPTQTDPDDVFRLFFSGVGKERNVHRFSTGEERICHLWKANWEDNPSLKLHPKPKPNMPLTAMALTARPSDVALVKAREEALFCDCTIQVGDKSFPAHRIILAARSPYFKRMLASPMKESAPDPILGAILKLEEVSHKCFQRFLDALYTETPPADKLHLDEIIELARFAHLAEVQPLYLWCESLLANSLSIDTFYTIAFHAYRMEDTQLLDYAAYFFARNEEAPRTLQIDLDMLDLLQVMEHLDLALMIEVPKLADACNARIKKALTDNREQFRLFCQLGLRFVQSKAKCADLFKEIATGYVSSRSREFDKPEMKSCKEAYKSLMSGLD